MNIHSISGTYRGITFKSLLELRFLKFLERHGLDIERDVIYEPGFVVYYVINGKRRRYIMDFHVVPWQAVYEVKHSKLLDDPVNVAKFAAAGPYCEKRGLKYLVWTEKLMNKFAPELKVTTRRALSDPNVVLNEAHVKNVRRQKRRANATKRRNARARSASTNS